MKKFWLILTLVCFVMVAVTACGGGEAPKPAEKTAASAPAKDAKTDAKPADAKPAAKQKVRIGYLVGDQLHQYTLPIGLEKGYFAEEGLEVEKKEFAAAGILMQGFGDIDFGLVGVSGVMAAKAAGTDCIVVGSLNRGGSALVVDPSITKFEDLKDQPVGNPGIGSNHHTLLTLLEQKYKTQTKKLTIKPTDMAIFASKKEVKGIICYEPWPTKVMQIAGFKRLLASNDILENQTCCVWVTSPKYVKEHPDVVDKILRVNAKATKYIKDYPDDSVKILAKASGHEEPVLKEAYKNMIYPWPPAVDAKSSLVLLQGLIDADKLPKDSVKKGQEEAWFKAMYDQSFEKKLLDSGYIAKLEKDGVPK